MWQFIGKNLGVEVKERSKFFRMRTKPQMRLLFSVLFLAIFLHIGRANTDSAQLPMSDSLVSDSAKVAVDSSDLISIAAENPIRLGILVLIGALLLISLVTLLTSDGRRSLRRARHLILTLISIEVGTGGFIRLMILSLLPSVGAAYARGYKPGQKLFDWHTFWVVLIGITSVTILYNLLQNSMHFKRILSPGAGHVWRDQRKATTAAIIKKINVALGKGRPLTAVEVRKLLADLLDIIVLHVRDHRGSFREDRQDVFANILLDAGDSLVVVARDSNCNTPGYTRQTPITYPKAGLICARAMSAKKPLSVGELIQAYPEGPKNKPYRSILALPLITSDDREVYGALSIDSSRPYFFETFLAGQAENQMENTLQPYMQLITLIFEALVHRSPQSVLELLRQTSANEPSKPGGT